MKSIKSYITVAALALSATASAQNLNTGYFNDGYLYRHELNPAFGNDMNYVAMPALGNMNIGLNSNIGIDKIFFNVNGRTTTFLHPDVSASKFAGGINSENEITNNLKLQILGAGFKAWGGYNTIEVNVRENLGLTVPGSLLKMMKTGLTNKEYNISAFDAHADAYAEIGFGHSREIIDGLRVGAKIKFLLGIANLDAEFNKAKLTLGENAYTADVNAKIQTSVKGLTYETETEMRGPQIDKNGNPIAQTEHKYVSGAEVDGAGLNGFGLAFDLGAEYKLDDNWKFSAAVLDLGFINWSNNMVASTNGDKHFTTETFILDPNDEDQNDAHLDKMEEDLAALYELQDNGDKGSRTRAIGATLNFGAEYTPDFYDKMSFGLMNATRIAGNYSWTDFRLSTNVAPTKWVSASASFGVGTYGASFGWLLDVHPKGFNLFLAMDRTFGKFAKPMVPKSMNGSFSMGINFPF